MNYNLVAVDKGELITIDNNTYLIKNIDKDQYYIKLGKVIQVTEDFIYNSVSSQSIYPIRECMLYYVQTSEGDTEIIFD